jgi:hypothetical protein
MYRTYFELTLGIGNVGAGIYCDLIHQRSTAIDTADLLKDVSWSLTSIVGA